MAQKLTTFCSFVRIYLLVYVESGQGVAREYQRVNDHHTEFYNDISGMGHVQVIEMVCDWWAMSEELGGSARTWADNNVGAKWKFTDKQVGWIYEAINTLELEKNKAHTNSAAADKTFLPE